MSYEYADKHMAQHWRRAAAMGGIPFFSPIIVVRGLWSVKVNLHPLRVCVEFVHSKHYGQCLLLHFRVVVFTR